jgi:hypothetical protein
MHADRRTAEELDRLAAFGRFVKRARQCAGISQQRLADLSGVSQSVISRCERGQAPRLALERVLAIQAVLGGCLPMGVCPHDHNCIWQPRADGDDRFLRRPGIATERVQAVEALFARQAEQPPAGMEAEGEDQPASAPGRVVRPAFIDLVGLAD